MFEFISVFEGRGERCLNLFLFLKDEVSSVLVEEYRTRLRKLVTSVGDYRVRRALPAAWSEAGMHQFKMSVESEASSLMLSPGGRTDP
jgi:hypothetical protein